MREQNFDELFGRPAIRIKREKRETPEDRETRLTASIKEKLAKKETLNEEENIFAREKRDEDKGDMLRTYRR